MILSENQRQIIVIAMDSYIRDLDKYRCMDAKHRNDFQRIIDDSREIQGIFHKAKIVEVMLESDFVGAD